MSGVPRRVAAPFQFCRWKVVRTSGGEAGGLMQSVTELGAFAGSVQAVLAVVCDGT